MHPSAQCAAVGHCAVRPRQHDSAILACKSGDQNLGLESTNTLRPESRGADALPSGELLRAVEHGDLRARLSDAKRPEINPDLVGWFARFRKPFHLADGSSPQPDPLELLPRRGCCLLCHCSPLLTLQRCHVGPLTTEIRMQPRAAS